MELPTASAPTENLVSPPDAPLRVTAAAMAKAQTFAQKDPQPKGKGLRVYVQGGGCSGFSYGYKLDEKRDKDVVIAAGAMNVYIDPASLGYVEGSLLDYVEDFRGSGFVIRNPKATSTCGCGESFSVS